MAELSRKSWSAFSSSGSGSVTDELEAVCAAIAKLSAVMVTKGSQMGLTQLADKVIPVPGLITSCFRNTQPGKEHITMSIVQHTIELLKLIQRTMILVMKQDNQTVESNALQLPPIERKSPQRSRDRLALPNQIQELHRKVDQLVADLKSIENAGGKALHRSVSFETETAVSDKSVEPSRELHDILKPIDRSDKANTSSRDKMSEPSGNLDSRSLSDIERIAATIVRSNTDAVKAAAVADFCKLLFSDPASHTEAVAAGVVPELAHLLGCGTDEAVEGAALALWQLSSDQQTRALVGQAGALPRLSALLTHRRVAVREKAAGALSSLAWEAHNCVAIATTAAIPLLVQMLKIGTVAAAENAAAAIWALSCQRSVQGAILSADAAMPLVSLLSEGSIPAAEACAGALWNLARFPGPQCAIAAAGAIPALVQQLTEGTDCLRERAAGALSHLASSAELAEAVADAGAVVAGVPFLLKGTDLSQRKVAKMLAALAHTTVPLQRVVEGGALPALVQLLEGGSEKAKEEAAQALLQCARTDSSLCSIICDCGAAPPLVQLLYLPSDRAVCRAAALIHVLAETRQCRPTLSAAGAVEGLVEVLKLGQEQALLQAMIDAAAALHSLLSEQDTTYTMLSAGAVPVLTNLVLSRSPADASRHAALLLCAIACEDELAERAAAQGAIAALVYLLSQSEAGRGSTEMLGDVLDAAVAAIWTLALRCPPTHPQLVQAGAVTVLALQLSRPSAYLWAVEALLALCHDEQYVPLVAQGEAPEALVPWLRHGCSEDERRRAAELLWLLAAESAVTRLRLARAGAVPLLVSMLSECEDAGRYQAAGVLWNLALEQTGADAIVAANALPPLVHLLDPALGRAHSSAAATLWNLSAHPTHQLAAGAAGAIPPMVRLLWEAEDEVRNYACAALRNLAICRPNRRLMAAAGAVPILVQCLQDGTEDCRLSATSALWYLALSSRVRSLIQGAGAVPVLLQVLSAQEEGGCSAVQAEEAVGALSALHVQPALLLEAGGWAPLHRLLNRDLARGDSKARQLLVELGHVMGVQVGGQ